MLEMDHLTVSGDVTFGKDVTLKVSKLSGLICVRSMGVILYHESQNKVLNSLLLVSVHQIWCPFLIRF